MESQKLPKHESEDVHAPETSQEDVVLATTHVEGTPGERQAPESIENREQSTIESDLSSPLSLPVFQAGPMIWDPIQQAWIYDPQECRGNEDQKSPEVASWSLSPWFPSSQASFAPSVLPTKKNPIDREPSQGPVMSSPRSPLQDDHGPKVVAGSSADIFHAAKGAQATAAGSSAASAAGASDAKLRKRTKTGCLTCRRRRIKCGEERPICNNCTKSRRNCEGYAQQLNWKPSAPDWGGLSDNAGPLQYSNGMLGGLGMDYYRGWTPVADGQAVASHLMEAKPDIAPLKDNLQDWHRADDSPSVGEGPVVFKGWGPPTNTVKSTIPPQVLSARTVRDTTPFTFTAATNTTTSITSGPMSANMLAPIAATRPSFRIRALSSSQKVTVSKISQNQKGAAALEDQRKQREQHDRSTAITRTSPNPSFAALHNLLSAELSEDLREQLLWEHQSTKPSSSTIDAALQELHASQAMSKPFVHERLQDNHHNNHEQRRGQDEEHIGYSSDDDIVYVRKELDGRSPRDHSPAHGGGLAEEVVPGTGAAQISREYRARREPRPSLGQTIRSGALGALTAAALERSKEGWTPSDGGVESHEWDTRSPGSHRPYTTARRYKFPAENEIDVEQTHLAAIDRHNHLGSVYDSDDRAQNRIVEHERERRFSPLHPARSFEKDRIMMIRHRSRSRSSSPATRASFVDRERGLASAAVAGLYERHRSKREFEAARDGIRSVARSRSRSRSRSRLMTPSSLGEAHKVMKNDYARPEHSIYDFPRVNRAVSNIAKPATSPIIIRQRAEPPTGISTSSAIDFHESQTDLGDSASTKLHATVDVGTDLSLSEDGYDSDSTGNHDHQPDARSELLEKLMTGFRDTYFAAVKTWLCQKHIRARQGNQSGTNAAGESNDNAIALPQNRLGGVGKHKRRSEDRDHDEEDGHSNQRKKPHISSPGPDDSVKRKFACPFFKRKPRTYMLWKSCPGPGWDSVHRLKEHLYRCHMLPIMCNRCGDEFTSDILLKEHQRAQTPCSMREYLPAEGIDATMKDRLRSRKKLWPNATEVDKWNGVYLILFPDDGPQDRPSPYYEYADDKTKAEDQSVAGSFQTMLRLELPAQVRRELEAEIVRELEPIEASLRGRLPEIIQVVLRRLLAINAPERAHKEPDDMAPLDVHGDEADSQLFMSTMNSEYRASVDYTEPYNMDDAEQFTWSQFPCEDFDWMINNAFECPMLEKDLPTNQSDLELAKQSASSGESSGSGG